VSSIQAIVISIQLHKRTESQTTELTQIVLNQALRLFVSQDINPIGMATRHGVKVKTLPESWLRPAEPSPDQRKINKLEGRVRELQATEPDLEVTIAFSCDERFCRKFWWRLSAGIAWT
jgi:hypothetical protein